MTRELDQENENTVTYAPYPAAAVRHPQRVTQQIQHNENARTPKIIKENQSLSERTTAGRSKLLHMQLIAADRRSRSALDRTKRRWILAGPKAPWARLRVQ